MEYIGRPKIIEFNSQAWTTIKENEEKIIDFFIYKKKEDIDIEEVGQLMFLSLKLILSELILHKEDYDKYPIINFKCNFIEKMAELFLHNKVPPSNDFEGTNNYIEEFRKNLWGHVKSQKEKISSALIYLTDKDDIDDMNYFEKNEIKKIKKDGIQSITTCLGDCLMIVFIENILRNRELKILENDWK